PPSRPAGCDAPPVRRLERDHGADSAGCEEHPGLHRSGHAGALTRCSTLEEPLQRFAGLLPRLALEIVCLQTLLQFFLGARLERLLAGAFPVQLPGELVERARDPHRYGDAAQVLQVLAA